MPSDIQIVNWALTRIGESSIGSLEDNNPNAQTARQIYASTRDSVLRAYAWNFALARKKLPALADAPVYQFQRAFQLPADNLRLVQVEEIYLGDDLSGYRTGDVSDFAIEGGQILTNFGAPLKIRYVKRVEDAALFDVSFADLLALELAMGMVEIRTQDTSKKESLRPDWRQALYRAQNSNAIERQPEKLADDEWIVGRI